MIKQTQKRNGENTMKENKRYVFNDFHASLNKKSINCIGLKVDFSDLFVILLTYLKENLAVISSLKKKRRKTSTQSTWKYLTQSFTPDTGRQFLPSKTTKKNIPLAHMFDFSRDLRKSSLKP